VCFYDVIHRILRGNKMNSLIGVLDDYQKKAVLAAASIEVVILVLALVNAFICMVLIAIFAGLGAWMAYDLFYKKKNVVARGKK
jgi:hypothetical protein